MRRFGLAMLGVGALALTLGSAVRADDDTFRLGTSSSGMLTGPSGGTDTQLVAHRGGGGGGGGGHRGGGGFHGGGFRGGGFHGGGFHGGGFHRGGYYGGYRGGYRGGYWGGGGWGGGYYGGYYPYYGGYYSGYSPYYYGGYYQPYYYGGYRCISLNGGDVGPYGVGLTVISAPTELTQLPVQQVPSAYQYQSAAKPQGLPLPTPVPAQNQTFPYDGGPCRTTLAAAGAERR